MSTKALGVVGHGLGRQKVGIELGSGDFYPNSIPIGDVLNFFPMFFTQDTHNVKQVESKNVHT